MKIDLCGAYVTEIRRLDKHGNPTGPNLCREPIPVTETGCNDPTHGHPVNTPGVAVPEVALDIHRTPAEPVRHYVAGQTPEGYFKCSCGHITRDADLFCTHLEEQPNFRDTAAGDDDEEPIDEDAEHSHLVDLIEQSSLGTPEVKAARDTVTPEHGRALVEEANRRSAGDGRTNPGGPW